MAMEQNRKRTTQSSPKKGVIDKLERKSIPQKQSPFTAELPRQLLPPAETGVFIS
ncbi:hypothetical protein BaRGS_00032579, partial [Batillaria attramentaria]